jgi:cysteine desulfurase
MQRTRRRVYLDYNATSPLDERVLRRIQPFLLDSFGNASSRDHAYGWDAFEAVEEARAQVAALINSRSGEIVFTSGATESINQALQGVARRGWRALVAAATEHEAVLETCRHIRNCLGAALELLPVDGAGGVDPTVWKRAVESAPRVLACLMSGNHETGVIPTIQRDTRTTQAASSLLFSDLTQAAGKIPIDVRAMGIDLAVFSAHKMCGPKGVGALFIRGGEPPIELEPLIRGGGQERGLRGGTLNVPGIVGFGEACRIALLELNVEAERVGRLRDRLENTLLSELPDIWINGDRANRLHNTSNIGFAGVNARTLISDMHDIAASTRSACSSSSQGPSHVLKAMGLTDEQAYSCIRFSLGRFTTEEEIDYAIQKVIASVTKLRKR